MFGGIRRPGRRAAAALAVLLLHLGVGWLLLHASRRDDRQPEAELTSVWLFPERPDPVARSPVVAAESPDTTTALRQPRSPGPARELPGESASKDPGSAPSIDWNLAAKEHVKRAGENLQASQPRGFGAVPSPQFRKCKPPKTSFEWDPDALKTGLDAVLPSFRVGKRCVVMPPFFGCALGELPPPNSHLLDDMKNPERDRKSVPGSGLCGEDKTAADSVPH